MSTHISTDAAQPKERAWAARERLNSAHEEKRDDERLTPYEIDEWLRGQDPTVLGIVIQ